MMQSAHHAVSEDRFIKVCDLGMREYSDTLGAMQLFTDARGSDTQDELWCVQHPPVYTQGLNCRQTTLGPTGIPILASDRGGQITYHGPGQLVIYVLFDIKRRGKGAKWLVHALEQSVIDLLNEAGLQGQRREGAPGVYVQGKKLAALGLRIRRGASYHGLSINVDMDLSPFTNIHPCGFDGLQVTQLVDLGIELSIPQVSSFITLRLQNLLSA